MKNKQAKINYADVWGLREEKYKFLEENDVKSTKWQELQPKETHYFFVPKNIQGEGKYRQFTSLDKVFGNFSTGVKTHRDDFILSNSKEDLKRKLVMFVDPSYNDEMIKSALNLRDTGTWRINEARSKFSKTELNEELFRRYSYRPFDSEWIYYDRVLVERSRREFIWNLSYDNLALVVTRQLSNLPFKHVFLSMDAPDICLLSLQTKESAYVFPLYLYEDKTENTLFEDKKRSNLKVEFVALLNQTYNPQPVTTPLNQQKTFDVSPEEIFYYIYAVLYSNAYRQKYQEFLKIDFPRIPFTKDYNLFKKLAELGEQLVNLHLLKSPELNNPISKFHGGNGNRVEKREYNEKEKRVYINNQQYFENIEPDLWNYYIGGYQVLDKWLKDRKGRALSSEDVKHYCKVVSALSKTIEIQKNINELYPRIEESLI